MFINKKILLPFVLLFPVLSIFPQTSVTINDYGAYFIDNGTVKRVPTTEDIHDSIFWRNYIIFDAETSVFRLIYNTENGAVSELLWPLEPWPRVESYYEGLGFFPLRHNGSNLLIYYNGMEYELDPVTLRTVGTREWGNNENVYEEHDYLRDQYGNFIRWEERQSTKWEGVGDVQRHYGKNYYLEITLPPNISNRINRYVHGGVDNKFVYIINNTPGISK